MRLVKSTLLFCFCFNLPATSSAQFDGESFYKQERPATEKVYVHTDRDFYFQGDTIWFKAYLVDGQNLSPVQDIQNLHIELIDSNGRITLNQLLLCIQGYASGSMVIPDTSVTGPFLLRAYTDFQRNFGEELFFHKRIRISEVKNSFEIESENSEIKEDKPRVDVSFFPEGGFLLAGIQNLVAFKAVDPKRRGVSIQGLVLNSDGKAVVAFKSEYMGMGRFVLNPERGESYKVILDEYPDFRYRFKDIRHEGKKIGLSKEDQEELTLQVYSNSGKRSREQFHIVCFSRDSLVFHKEFTHRGSINLKVEKELLLGGINRFILLNEELEPVSERMVFRDNLDINKLEIRTTRKEFATRSPVQLEILDDRGILDSAYSSVSISVVNENSLIAGGDYQHLASYLFLDSELKGYIESPADFFVDDLHITSREKLNLLMLTHGWSNYLKSLTEVNHDEIKYQKAAGITITGNTERISGKKPIVNGAITFGLFTDRGNFFWEAQTDSSGYFSRDSLFFADTATIFAQVLNDKGKQRSKVRIETDLAEKPDVSLQTLSMMKNISDLPLQQYRHKYNSDIDYRNYYAGDGSILLEEVEITGKKIEKDDGNFRIYMKADDVLEVNPSDHYYANVLQFLQGRVAGLKVSDSGVSLRGTTSILGGSSPMFILDGMPISDEPLDLIMSIPMTNIDKVEVLKGGSAAIYGSRGNNGVIAVYTKKGGNPVPQDYELIGAITKKVAGFASNREFYSPQYTLENSDSPVPDHRTTLYWNPELNTETGRATISFYTADDLGYFRIIVEGITENGQICLGSAKFMVDSHHK